MLAQYLGVSIVSHEKLLSDFEPVIISLPNLEESGKIRETPHHILLQEKRKDINLTSQTSTLMVMSVAHT